MKTLQLTLFGLIALTLAGCVNEPARLDSIRNGWLQEGTTTMAQAKQILGAPRVTHQAPNGIFVAHYLNFHEERTSQGAVMGDATGDPRIWRFGALSLLSRKDGVIVSHWEHQSRQLVSVDLSHGGHALHSGPVLDAASVGQIKRGETSEKELITWLGQPALQFMSAEQTLTLVWIEGNLPSTFSQKWAWRSLSVALDEHGTASRHSVMETTSLDEAMSGFSFR